MMNMIAITLRQNNNPYPFYGATTVVDTVTSKPVAKNLRSGYIDMQLDNMNFNYLSYPLKAKTLYAWVTDIEYLSGNMLYRVRYEIDAFRTYRSNITIGTQFIERSPEPTNLPDAMLGSVANRNTFFRAEHTMGDTRYRYCVIQSRPPKTVENWQSKTPGIPTPYQFWICRYDVNNWVASSPIAELLDTLKGLGRTTNIVTMYSVPYVNLSVLNAEALPVFIGEDSQGQIPGWYRLANWNDTADLLTTYTPIMTFDEEITKTRHSVNLVFPDAGIMNIPDELLFEPNLTIRRDVDLFSGACNYMLCYNNTIPTHKSLRGSALSSIPILSDPYDTYLSQNQNTLAVSLLGDVANLGVSVFTGNIAGIGSSGASMINRFAGLEDAKTTIPNNPPAFLGSALIKNENNRFWVEIVRKPYTNASAVNARYGYPKYVAEPVTLPNEGFIKLQNCSVQASGHAVPLWAIEEINNRLNEGIFFT